MTFTPILLFKEEYGNYVTRGCSGMDNETKIVLDADAKEYALKAISEVYSGFSFLYNQLKEDQAERSLVDSVLGLSEHYIAKIGDRLGYNGTLKKELEERHVAIRTANLRIRELEQQLGSSKPINGFKEQVKYLGELIEKFWQDQGFGTYIKDFSLSKWGVLKLELTFSLDRDGSLLDDENPVSSREAHRQRIESLRERSFELLQEECRRYEMRDCDSNKTKLIEIIRARFPSAVITRFEVRSMNRNQDTFYISSIEFYIRDLMDLAE